MSWQEQTVILSVQKRLKTVILPTLVDCKVQLLAVVYSDCSIYSLIYSLLK